MKKFMKTIIMMLVVTMLLGINGITVNAADEETKVSPVRYEWEKTAGWQWIRYAYQDTYIYKTHETKTKKFYDENCCLLSDFVMTHDESEWPEWLIKGTDGVPYYIVTDSNVPGTEIVRDDKCASENIVLKLCLDPESRRWVMDMSYSDYLHKDMYWIGYQDSFESKGFHWKGETPDQKEKWLGSDWANAYKYYAKVKEDIANGKAGEYYMTGTPAKITEEYCGRTWPEGWTEPEKSTNEPEEPVDEFTRYDNIQGLIIKLEYEYIEPLEDNAPQRPLPRKVELGSMELSYPDGYSITYEKWDSENNKWMGETDSVTDEGTYLMWITAKQRPANYSYFPRGAKKFYVVKELPESEIAKREEYRKKYDKDYVENTLGATVTLKTDCLKATGKAMYPRPSSVKIGKKALKFNRDYTVSYSWWNPYNNEWQYETSFIASNTSTGRFRMTVEGMGSYEGRCSKIFYITSDKTIKAMSSAKVKVNKMSYTGEAITTGVIKSVKSGRRTLTEGTDYTVTYINNVNSGTGQVILTAIEGSGFLGTKTVNFTITGNKMNKVKVNGISSIVYNPETDLVQDMSKISLTFKGTKLNEGTDFTVSYTNNVKAGTAKVTFTGKGLYNGTLTKKFKITKAPLKADMLDDESKDIELTYTGKALKPDVTLKNGDVTLKKGTDYTLAYKNNIKVSTDAKPTQIVVKGKGNYTGSFTVNFKVVSRTTADTNTKKNPKDGTSADEELETEAPAPDEEPITEEPETVDEPETETDEPETDEPVADEPETDTEEPETDTGKPETDTEKPETDTGKPETEPDKPETDTGKPETDEPAHKEPVTDEPVVEEPATDKPTADEPAIDEPVAEEPETVDEPEKDEPVTEKPETETDKPETETVNESETVEEPATVEEAVTEAIAENESAINHL